MSDLESILFQKFRNIDKYTKIYNIWVERRPFQDLLKTLTHLHHLSVFFSYHSSFTCVYSFRLYNNKLESQTCLQCMNFELYNWQNDTDICAN